MSQSCLRLGGGIVPRRNVQNCKAEKFSSGQTVLLWSCHIAGNSISTVALRFV